MLERDGLPGGSPGRAVPVDLCSCWSGGFGFDRDVEAHGFQLGDEPPLMSGRSTSFIEVIATEIRVRFAGR